MKDWEGKQIGKCQVLEKLGAGTCGIVYKARHVLLDKIVALKVLNPVIQVSDEDHSETVERFMREARSAARLEHPNIISIYDIGEEDGHYYIVMQYIEGQSLRDIIEENVKLDYRQVLHITREVAKGLQVAHKKGIVHRDIKPENIMVSKDGIIKITDFGVAKQLNDDSGLTQAGRTYGTPLYISPEQAMGKDNIDGRADLYSLGIIIYHALVGEPPYQAKNSLIVMQQHVNAPIPCLREKVPEIPEPVEQLFQKLVAKIPDQRFADAQEIIDAVDAVLDPSSFSALPAAGGSEDIQHRRQLYSELVETKCTEINDNQVSSPSVPYPNLFDTGEGYDAMTEEEGQDGSPHATASQLPYLDLFSEEEEVTAVPDYPKLEEDYGQKEAWDEPPKEESQIQLQVGLAPEDFSPRRSRQLPTSLSQTQSRESLTPDGYISTRRKTMEEMSSPGQTQRRQALAPGVIPKGFAEVARSLKKTPSSRSVREEANPSQAQMRNAYRPRTPGHSTAQAPSTPQPSFSSSPPPSEQAPVIIDRWKTPTSINSDSSQMANEVKTFLVSSVPEGQQRDKGTERYNRLTDSPGTQSSPYPKTSVKPSIAKKRFDRVLPTVLTLILIVLTVGGGWWGIELWRETSQKRARLLQIQNITGKIYRLLQEEKYREASEYLVKSGSLLSKEYLEKTQQSIVHSQEQKKQRQIQKLLGNKGWFDENMPVGMKRHSQRGLYIWQKDGSTMVHVPAGLFLRGSKQPGDESPMRTVWIDAFYIDKYELTSQQYREFCQRTGHPMPKSSNSDNEPVTDINWHDVQAYAKWAGKKLPTEAEWEKAARGGGYIPDWAQKTLPQTMKRNDLRRRIYPWGDQLPETTKGFLSNYRQGKEAKDGYAGVAEVGLFPEGDSPYMCSDMAGNVKEWCHDFYRKDYYQDSPRRNPQGPGSNENNMIVCRGGSFTTIERFLYCTRRWHYQSSEKYNDLGVRLAK